MKKVFWRTLIVVILSLCLALGLSACGGGNDDDNSGDGKIEKSFTISCPTEMMAGERIEIKIEKSYDFNMYHDDYEWIIVGENTVGGSFEFEMLDPNSNYNNKFFRATTPGTVKIQAVNHTSGTLTSNIVEITVKGNYISTVEEFKAIANTDKPYILGADIDLSDESNWTPIEGFTGSLFGGGHKIINLTIDSVNGENIGLFGTLQGTVQDLIIENASINVRGEKRNVGILAGANKGTVKNVTVDGEISAKYNSYVGGIAGYSENGVINDCTNAATILGANYVGGIVGSVQIYDNDTLNGNENNGEITGKENVGGIAGYLTNLGHTQFSSIYTVSDNTNNNEIIGTSNVGGIFGTVCAGQTQKNHYSTYFYDYIEMTLLKNTAEVSASGDCVGGLIGYSTRLSKLSLCENIADVSGGNYVGGFAGYAPECNILASDFANLNTITGKGYVGGFAGYAGVIENAVNDGTILSTAVIIENSVSRSYVGGIAGYCNGLIECTNNSDIAVTASSSCYVGGLAGYICMIDSEKVNGNENNGEITGKENVGGIAGYLTNLGHTQYSATYTLCDNTNNNEIIGTSNVGGIFGTVCAGETQKNHYSTYFYDYIEMTLLKNTAAVSASGDCVGGLIGYSTRLSKLSLCENLADVSGENYVGGFVGYAPECNILASDFTNLNTITGKGYVGGFAGYAGVIENAVNDGTILSTAVIIENGVSKSYVGGIAGYCNGLIECTNNSDITMTKNGSCYVGGLAGYICMIESETVNNNINNGKIVGKDSVGGIAGYLTNLGHTQYSATYTLSGNTNNGEINATSNVGGIFGTVCAGQTQKNHYSTYFYDYIEITECTNNAKLKGTYYVGGIVGSYTRLVTDSNVMDTNTTAYGNKLGQ
ncbi:MAG: hypothetical protein J6V80_01825 [Clostridia bacterium]|nr:hypothetical protein [Clostridia bacterium]